jgi:hypothetical protein
LDRTSVILLKLLLFRTFRFFRGQIKTLFSIFLPSLIAL